MGSALLDSRRPDGVKLRIGPSWEMDIKADRLPLKACQTLGPVGLCAAVGQRLPLASDRSYGSPSAQ